MTSIGKRLAIIGAGFSGSLLAIHLLRRSGPGDRIYLFERNAQFGRGLAYSTGNPNHLLNVRASNMSAFADQPDHFLEWLRRLSPEQRRAVRGDDGRLTFAPRQLYGSYIQSILAEGIWGESSGRNLYLVADEAVEIAETGEGVSIQTGCGRNYDVDAAVLAIGNFPPDESRPGYIGDPWDWKATEHLDPRQPVLLVGTGLTMIDVVISLLDQEHEGPILAISRRGLIPATHAATTPYPRFLPAETAPRSVTELLRRARAEVERARAEGQDWRPVIDALRPDTQEIWRRLALSEKRRFLRHLRSWWDIHRHRMAPQVAERIAAARERGQLIIRRGRLRGMEPGHAHVEAEIAFADEPAPSRLRVARIINCSGPQSDYGQIADPLVRGMVQSGIARADPLALGLDVTGDGAVIAEDGSISGRLYALGPVTKGVFWETTAVPDIRRQADHLADHLSARSFPGSSIHRDLAGEAEEALGR
jgi:uncharacterized NAD(P)/FAD-binding protein YdhS